MCRVKKLLYTKCNHVSDVMPAYEDDWYQYKRPYPATPFADCPNSNKGAAIQTYPEWDWYPDCKDRGMHRGEIEARAQAIQATIRAQGIQAILPAAPIYQPLQPNQYQVPPFQQQQVQNAPDPNQQQQIQYAPDPNQQVQYQPDPYQRYPEYQADPGYYASAPGSPVQAASPYAPGSPVDQGYQPDAGYRVDTNAAAGQRQGYPGGQVSDSASTAPTNPYNQYHSGNYPH
ncbi:hypothetical protein BKA64DRAFT_647084 [Cadophora sp. MPI-SDFR-AT-0126]|nr:hypothetical protein BKA64DRAFT_647084 [Leotiomycetes sp. MPI-SDFR-AT-0126]